MAKIWRIILSWKNVKAYLWFFIVIALHGLWVLFIDCLLVVLLISAILFRLFCRLS
jgi:hypothetical protein